MAFLVFFQFLESLSGESELTAISHIAMVAPVNAVIEVSPLSTHRILPELEMPTRMGS